jgi:hypothetical protein
MPTLVPPSGLRLVTVADPPDSAIATAAANAAVLAGPPLSVHSFCSALEEL